MLEHTAMDAAGLTHRQIEDDAQDGMNDIRSPGTEDIISPASQTSQSKVRRPLPRPALWPACEDKSDTDLAFQA